LNAVLNHPVECRRLSNATKINAKCFDFDEKLLQIDDFLVSDEALEENADETDLQYFSIKQNLQLVISLKTFTSQDPLFTQKTDENR
jgi:hypothetical protein